jgi:uncharacterized protein with von Willebrand factor type A (vWA) domain
MHPAELLEPNGQIDPRRTSPTPGIYWLHQIAAHFDRGVWMNPEPPHDWNGYPTARVIKRLFPMFHLSVDGWRTRCRRSSARGRSGFVRVSGPS